jgi:leucyl-tRNA---protein transferase
MTESVFSQSPRDPSPVVVGPAHPCPYLDDRDARFAYAVRMPDGPGGFESLLDAGFRRSGLYVYRTACEGCDSCRPLRVPVATFRPNRSQARALARNLDLDVALQRPELTSEKLQLFRRYLTERHDGQMSSDRDDVEAGLYRSPVDTFELVARRKGRLVGVGVVDLTPSALSLVYFAYDPDERARSLGTAFVCWSIGLAEALGRAYVHLGYRVAEAPNMAYKARFRPHEVLDPDGVWRGGPV